MFPKLPTRLPAGAPAGSYVALEKIHGAQLVIGLDARGELSIGKRKAWLHDDDPFFGWQLIRAGLADAAHRLRELVDKRRQKAGPGSGHGHPRGAAGALPVDFDLVMYGELFGGGYPHPEVEASGVYSPVQTGIWYAPDLRFALFCIAVAAPGDPDGTLLAPTETLRLGARVGLACPPVIAHGSLAELHALPVRFPTRFAATVGLPPIEGNTAEGLVLWADRPASLSRPFTMKQKIPEMSELRFAGSAAFAGDRLLPLPELLGFVPGLVNRARVDSAASKVGRHDTTALIEEIELDIMCDLDAALPMTMRALEPEDLRAVSAAVHQAYRQGPRS